MAETMTANLKEDPPSLSEASTKIAPSLERIVRRCLEKKPERRFQTASDLGFALEGLSDSSGSSASQGVWSRAEPIALAHRWSRERLLWGALGLATGAVVVGVVFWLLIGRPRSGTATPQAVRRMTIKLQASPAWVEL